MDKCFFCEEPFRDNEKVVVVLEEKTASGSGKKRKFYHEECLSKWERNVGPLVNESN